MSSESTRAGLDGTTPRSRQRQRETDHPAKRLKAVKACEECQSRKVRCDGARPVCGACRGPHRAPRYCVYQSDRLDSALSQLDDRVRTLETSDANIASTIKEPIECRDQSEQWEAMVQRQSGPSEARRTSPNGVTSSGNVQRHHNTDIAYGPQEDTPQLMHPVVESVDAMGNFGTAGSSYDRSGSCAASFVKSISDAVTARLSSTRKQQSVASWEELKVLQPGQSAAEIFMLPSRKAADEMMEVYWHRFHILFPFLCRPRFTSVYQSLWTGECESINESSIYCLLNSIFAISCRLTKKSVGDEKDSAADYFSRRAIQLLQVNVIGSGCVELVQSLLHMAFYLQSTDSPNTCWVVTGLAIRIAQGLGLHLPRTSSNLEHQQDREMARRLWHGCVFVDRLVSMTLGRPPTITKTNALSIPLPASIDDEYLSTVHESDSTQPPEEPSKTEFYVQSLKLYVLQEETLSVMYSDEVTEPNLTLSEKIERLGFNNVLKIDTSLQKWNDSLPPFLRVPQSSDEVSNVPAFSKQANTLHLHWLQVRILLLRPFLSLLLTPSTRKSFLITSSQSMDLPHLIAMACARKCIVDAQNVIKLIDTHQVSIEDPLPAEYFPAWWIGVSFIYTAATVLIPARSYSYIRGDIPPSDLMDAWNNSLDILHRLGHVSGSATRCLTVLRALDQAIVSEHGNPLATHHDVGDIRSREMSSIPSINPSTPLNEPNLGEMAAKNAEMLQTQTEQPDIFADSSLPRIQDFGWFDSLLGDWSGIDTSEFFTLAQANLN